MAIIPVLLQRDGRWAQESPWELMDQLDHVGVVAHVGQKGLGGEKDRNRQTDLSQIRWEFRFLETPKL